MHRNLNALLFTLCVASSVFSCQKETLKEPALMAWTAEQIEADNQAEYQKKLSELRAMRDKHGVSRELLSDEKL